MSIVLWYYAHGNVAAIETLASFGAEVATPLWEYEAVERHNVYLTELAAWGLKVTDHPST